MKSLAEHLGFPGPRPEERAPVQPSIDELIDVSDPVAFCRGIVASREFRQYIMDGVILRELPPTIARFIMEHAMGKPPERVEHTGKDGGPLVAEVRRVIIHTACDLTEMKEEEEVTKH